VYSGLPFSSVPVNISGVYLFPDSKNILVLILMSSRTFLPNPKIPFPFSIEKNKFALA